MVQTGQAPRRHHHWSLLRYHDEGLGQRRDSAGFVINVWGLSWDRGFARELSSWWVTFNFGWAHRRRCNEPISFSWTRGLSSGGEESMFSEALMNPYPEVLM